MNSDLPKVLVPLHGRPMIRYLLDSVAASGIEGRPLIVVSPANEDKIKEALADVAVDFIRQENQLGTGNAVASAMAAISPETSRILVLYGDHPFFHPESLAKIAASNPQPLVMMTTQLSDFEAWRHNFYHWGRIIRDAAGQIIKIVEFKDASEEERAVTEVNPAVMCFDKEWLAQHLSRLDNNNKSGEYYLTDMVKIAFSEDRPVGSIAVEPHEAMGINSLEELKIAEEIIMAR